MRLRPGQALEASLVQLKRDVIRREEVYVRGLKVLEVVLEIRAIVWDFHM